MQLDAMTAHWEFAYGPEHFKNITKQLNYPMLAINCYDKKSNELVYEPYLIKELEGLKVGIIGIAATIVDKVMPPKFSEGIYFTLGNEELPGYIDKLKSEGKVDLIVVLSHLGFPQDVKLAQEVSGIDVLLSAHTHNRMFKPAIINNTIIMQSGCHGSFIGRLDLELNAGKITNFKHELVLMDRSVPHDLEIVRMIDEIMGPHRFYLSQVVGHTLTDLDRYTALESTMDNFMLKSIMEFTGAEMVFSNGWRYGAPIPRGPVTMNDLWNIIPVNPPVSLVELSGTEVQEMMEENLERTFAINPYDQMGGYVKRCLGLTVYVKLENPFGQRIQELFVGNRKLEPDQSYKVAFVTMQGVPEKYGRRRMKTENQIIDVMFNYLKKHQIVQSPFLKTVVVV
jgi:2',3'-cyclic-nucleotide 2'-phosphodiesterase (5'-nucleotidase family)